MKWSQYNQVPSVLRHPNVHGILFPKFTVIHFTSVHFKTKSLHIYHVSSLHITTLHITSLIYTQSPLQFPCL